MSLNGFVRFITMQLVTDKGDRQRETQKIMGLSHSAYMTGTLLSAYIIAFGCALLYLIPALIGNLWGSSNLNPFQVIGSYLLYMFSIVHMVFLISSFFSDPKLSADIVSLITLFFSFSYLLVFSETFRESTAFIASLSIFPPACINFTWFSADWWLDSRILTYNGISFSFTGGCFALFIDAVVYLALYLYLDQVWPN